MADRTYQAETDAAAVFDDVYRATIILLGSDCPDRLELAGVAAVLARCGSNISRSARCMGRSRRWVRLQRDRLRQILPDPDVSEIDNYLEVS